MKYQKIRMGIIGLGRIGRIHLENLLTMPELVQVIGAVDVLYENRSWAKEKGIANIFENHDSLLAMDELDAVAICSPTSTHFDIVKACCARGVDIFCEKPLETTLDRIKRIEELADTARIQLQVGFQRRFDPDFCQIRESIKNQRLGDIHLVNITSRDPGPPPMSFVKTSGGLFMDMTIHDFDMARFLLNDEAEEVFVMADVRVDEAIGQVGDVDTAMVIIRFKNRALVHIDNSRKAVYGYDQRAEVFGEKGMIQTFNRRQENYHIHDSQGFHGSSPYNFFLDRYATAYREEMRSFLESIAQGQEILVGIKDAFMSTAIALAAGHALKHNRVVKLEEIFKNENL